MNAWTKDDLKAFQAETLEQKIQRSFAKIGEWFAYWNNQVYVSFSGGKDSTVLADLCAQWCKIINAPLYLVFVNTGLEYLEIQKHVKFFAQWLRDKYEIEVVLEILRPELRFDEVIKKYGYPMISKEVAKCVSAAKRLDSKYGQVSRAKLNGTFTQDNGEKSKYNQSKWKPLLDVDFMVSDRCCEQMKKNPSHKYNKESGRKQIVATMAEESRLREQNWLKMGCNAFKLTNPSSTPMSFWTEQDVLRYIKERNIPIASVYGDIVYEDQPEQYRIEGYDDGNLRTTGCSRTGCVYCSFGCHLEKPGEGRFELLKKTHPRQWEYCIGGGEYDANGKWVPNKQGIGLGHVFDELNKIYGDGFIRYGKDE